ncbi:MAG: hypothetical protein ACPH7H_06550 [Porticoccaceae bacterium]
MQPIHKKYKNLSNSVKTLSRQQFMICALLVVSALSYCWVKYLQPEHNSWDETSIQLPDTEELQLYIDKKITQKSEISRQVNNPLDEIIDDQAMQIKLSGLTKNITTERVPTDKELSQFYQQHQEQYRQISSFEFTQYLLTNIRYGGQAVSMAQKILNTAPANRKSPQALVSLNTLEIDRLYGAEFSKKIMAEILEHPQNLPCWTKPITSKIGAHLLCFKQVNIGTIPELESIKPQLVNHWRYENAREQSETM